MEKNYKHKINGKPCNAAQYIAEMVCLRKAEKERTGRQGDDFWNTPKWKKEFQSQVTKAYGLLKKYSDKAIIAALNSYAGKSIFSLRVKSLDKLIKKEQFKLDKQAEKPVKPVEVEDNTSSKPRKPFGKKSQLSLLRGLENGKKED